MFNLRLYHDFKYPDNNEDEFDIGIENEDVNEDEENINDEEEFNENI